MTKEQAKKFTEEENKVIIENYGKITSIEIGKLLNLSPSMIQRQAKNLGVWVNGTERKWTQEEDEYIKQNYGILTSKQIGEKINRGYTSVKKRAQRLGLSKKSSEKWTDEEIAILKENYDKYENKDIANNILNRSKSSIEHKFMRLPYIKEKIIKISEPKKLGRNQIFFGKTNHDFFQIPNLLNSFVAGLLSADGNISKKNKIIIYLKSTDKEYLQGIFRLFSDHELTTKTQSGILPQGTPYTSILSGFQFTSKKVCDDLKQNFNIIPKKSLIYEPPINLNLENSLAFIIGNLDGDGSIILDSNKRFSIKFNGTENFLLWVQKTLSTIIDISNLKLGKRKLANGYLFDLRITGKKAVKIYNVLNKIKVPKLQRKWNNSKLSIVPELEIING